MLDWVEDSEDVAETDPIIDLGCGNGVMLVELVSIQQENKHWKVTKFMS